MLRGRRACLPSRRAFFHHTLPSKLVQLSRAVSSHLCHLHCQLRFFLSAFLHQLLSVLWVCESHSADDGPSFHHTQPSKSVQLSCAVFSHPYHLHHQLIYFLSAFLYQLFCIGSVRIAIIGCQGPRCHTGDSMVMVDVGHRKSTKKPVACPAKSVTDQRRIGESDCKLCKPLHNGACSWPLQSSRKSFWRLPGG